MTKNHDLEVVKKYLEGALSVENLSGAHNDGYRLAIQNSTTSLSS